MPPDGCALGFRAGDGEVDAVEVYVGKEFGTVRRAIGLPTVVGSRVAYQSYFRPGPNAPAGVKARCYINIPISATRVIMVGAPPLGGTVEARCADGRMMAASVAAKLDDPRSLARNPSPTSILAESAPPVVGQVDLAADPAEPTEDVRAAGRTGVECLKGEGTYRAAFPATGTNATDEGALRMTVVEVNRRGDSTEGGPYELSRVRDVTVAIAENVITRCLS